MSTESQRFGETKEYYYEIESKLSSYDDRIWCHRIHKVPKDGGYSTLVAEIIGKNVDTYDYYEEQE